MSSCAKYFTLTSLSALLLILSGCFDAHPCGHAETCNFEDDDCDGLVDEDFLDEAGRYTERENCGGCGVDCTAVFPSAEETTCTIPDDALPFCSIVSCPVDTHLAGTGGCVPNLPVLCLPCDTDADCELREPGARCLPTATGQNRCGAPCLASRDCPTGFSCDMVGATRQCISDQTLCACIPSDEPITFGCFVEAPDGHQCAGSQLCGPTGLTDCAPALDEVCNGTDDDCDGETDEDFRNDAGLYTARLHCGECAHPCVAPGPNMLAECLADLSGENGVRCQIECLEGFVDVDGIDANGCECERWDGVGPPPVVGGDSDCDGLPDDTAEFIYVTTAGNDSDAGTLAHPMRTIQAALERGRDEGKSVLISRGIYDGDFDVVGGVSIFGGYSPDFRDRDLDLFPVLVERRLAAPGTPVLTCHNIRTATRIEGFTLQGTDATGAGEGSTTVYFDGCGPELTLSSLIIVAGRGADGVRGPSSSDNLSTIGLSSLTELVGTAGTPGAPGSTAGMMCPSIPAGVGGSKTCPSGPVSGGNGGDGACPDTMCTNGSPCGNGGCTDYTVGGVCDIAAVMRDAVANPAAQNGSGVAPGVAGEVTYNAPTNRGVCNFCDDNPTLARIGDEGGDGASGANGRGGLGCSGVLRFDPITGRIGGGDGTGGAAGIDGSGGGGGTAGAGFDVIGGTSGMCNDAAGGSGGGGGSGGCGAPRADGGTGGGASVGMLVRLNATLTSGPVFDRVRIVTASGGAGGDGGIGASGGAGASGAPGGEGRFFCARSGGRGGDGGSGGAGGGGGGGCGGGSHGVFIEADGAAPEAYAAQVRMSAMIEETGVAGRAGNGGFSPGSAGTPGTPGTLQSVFIAP
jgi:hypothetical protein